MIYYIFLLEPSRGAEIEKQPNQIIPPSVCQTVFSCLYVKLNDRKLLYIMSKEPKREENNEDNYEQDEQE